MGFPFNRLELLGSRLMTPIMTTDSGGLAMSIALPPAAAGWQGERWEFRFILRI
jgi:hypothetical protein